MAGVETEIVNVGGASVLRVKGKMVSGAASQSLRAAFEKILSEAPTRIVLNLSDVPFIDSAGLGALTIGRTIAMAAGVPLMLSGLQERVSDAMNLTLLSKKFSIYATETDALAAVPV